MSWSLSLMVNVPFLVKLHSLPYVVCRLRSQALDCAELHPPPPFPGEKGNPLWLKQLSRMHDKHPNL